MDASPTLGAATVETPLGRLVKSLPERLAERVLEDVMTGRLRPGDRLKEEVLAQTHAVSRATVREALIALARQGYVVRIPRSGARIAEFSRNDLDDLFELRAALLAVAAGRYARGATPAMHRVRRARNAATRAGCANSCGPSATTRGRPRARARSG